MLPFTSLDPWPRASANRRIPANGERMAGAYERYRNVDKPPPQADDQSAKCQQEHRQRRRHRHKISDPTSTKTLLLPSAAYGRLRSDFAGAVIASTRLDDGATV